MAAVIKDEFGIAVDYIKSGGGVFEVTADGKLIYSKKATGRFPEHSEVISKLKSILG